MFKEALDPDLRHGCGIRRVPDQMQAWYNMAVVLDLEIHPHRNPATDNKPARRPLDADPR